MDLDRAVFRLKGGRGLPYIWYLLECCSDHSTTGDMVLLLECLAEEKGGLGGSRSLVPMESCSVGAGQVGLG